MPWTTTTESALPQLLSLAIWKVPTSLSEPADGDACRPTDALHTAGVTSFVAQQPQEPAQPKTELINNSDGTQTVIVKMPNVPDPASLQVEPFVPSLSQCVAAFLPVAMFASQPWDLHLACL
jgi:hypothetical protein